ncbi:hypothetical protein D3C75_1005640 [compost metagenome]
MRPIIFALTLTGFLGGCVTSQQYESPLPHRGSSVFSIFPEAPLFAEASMNSDGSITLTKIDKITNPNVTLIFNFVIFGEGRMLTIHNSLDETVKFHIDTIDYKGEPHNISSCTMPPGMVFLETWPDPFPEIRVSNAHVALENEEGTCVY